MAEITKPSGVDLNRIWAETGNKVDPGATKTAEGWLPEVPTCEVDNYMYYKRDKFIAHINQRGFPEWDSTTEYQANKSYIQGSDGTVFKCTQTHSNKNPVSAPDTTSYWVIAFDPFDTSYTKAEGDLRYLQVSNNFSDVNNAALARTNLGLGSAATRTVGTSVTNVMEVGAFGLGNTSSATAIPSNNCNSVTANGLYLGTSSTANRFTGSSNFTLLHINHSASYATQLAQDASNGYAWYRAKNNGVWQAWHMSFHTGNVSGYAATLLDDVDAASARATLGLTGQLDPNAKVNRSGDTMTGILNVISGFRVLAQGASEGGEMFLQRPPSGSALAADLSIDLAGNRLRIFENGGSFRGAYIDITSCNASIASYIWHSGNVWSSFGTNGYVRFPNGLILQWGQCGTSSGSGSGSLPTTFPNICFGITVGMFGLSGPQSQFAIYGTASNSTWNVWSASGTSLGGFYFAVGY